MTYRVTEKIWNHNGTMFVTVAGEQEPDASAIRGNTVTFAVSRLP